MVAPASRYLVLLYMEAGGNSMLFCTMCSIGAQGSGGTVSESL